MERPEPKFKLNQKVYVSSVKQHGCVASAGWLEHMDMYQYLVILSVDGTQKVVPETVLENCDD